MKIDLIIPVFKKKGLRESLMSINRTDLVSVVIVDDGQHNDYTDILEEFKDFFEIKIIQLEKNVGQGLARQAGIEASNNEFIMFLDCGDLIYSPDLFEFIINAFERQDIYTVRTNYRASFNNRIVDEGTLTANGQAYRRCYLEMHNIGFCPTDLGSRKYEDVGFVAQCCLANMVDTRWFSYNFDRYSLIKILDENSITIRDNESYNFLDRMEGVFENLSYAVDKYKTELIQKNVLLYKNAIFGYFVSLCVILEIINNHNPNDTEIAFPYLVKWYKRYIQSEDEPNEEYWKFVIKERLEVDRYYEKTTEEFYCDLINIYKAVKRA